MTIKPQFEFNKYDFGLGIVLRRENESKKYIRKHRTINYIFGIILLWFSFGVEVEIIGVLDENKRN